jgi:branched-chain amino acid transport system ATP-binding protein
MKMSSRRIWETRPLLSVKGIHVYYGKIQVLSDIRFQVGEREILTVVGSNGSGKSTLLKTISGLMRPESGTIEFLGEDVTNAPDYEIVSRGLVRVPEGRKLFPTMTVLENLEMGSLNPLAKRKRKESMDMVFGLFPILRNRARQLAGTLSGGEQQMAAIGRGLMAVPKVLMLDEPSLGLAPLIVLQVFETIKRINELGTTILLVEQNVFQSLLISTTGLVLENGKITMEKGGKELLENDHVRKAYLGT